MGRKKRKKNRDKNKDPKPKESSGQGAFYSKQERSGIPKRGKNKNWLIRRTPHVSALNSFEFLFWS